MSGCHHYNASTTMSPAPGGKTRYTVRCNDCNTILHEYEA